MKNSLDKPSPKPIYLCDIDGTIADISHRLHFIQQEKADWRGFFAACIDDKPIPEVIALIRHLGKAADILMLTGRSEQVRMETRDWLVKHNVPHQAIYMRGEGDHRQDDIVKAEFLEHILRRWKVQEILGAFEDRKQVVDMYRSKGLRVYQVAEGEDAWVEWYPGDEEEDKQTTFGYQERSARDAISEAMRREKACEYK